MRQLVRIFNRQRTNPHSAQLIFNSFEASLLGNSVDDRILGRDQVWFTEKLHDGSRYGASPLVSDEEFDALAVEASGGPAE